MRFVLLVIVFSSVIYCKDVWYDDNLKNIEDIYLVLNVQGVEDNVWEKRMYSFMELRFLEHKINIVNSQIPKLVMDINIIDSRVEETSSFLVSLSLYNYSISEAMYYKSIADTLITKKLMTSKVFSNEIMGQSSSGNLYSCLLYTSPSPRDDT